MLFIIGRLTGPGIIGRLASMSMRSDAEQGTLLNVVGTVSLFVAGLVLTPRLGIGTVCEGSPWPSRVDGAAAGRIDSRGSGRRLPLWSSAPMT